MSERMDREIMETQAKQIERLVAERDTEKQRAEAAEKAQATMRSAWYQYRHAHEPDMEKAAMDWCDSVHRYVFPGTGYLSHCEVKDLVSPLVEALKSSDCALDNIARGAIEEGVKQYAAHEWRFVVSALEYAKEKGWL